MSVHSSMVARTRPTRPRRTSWVHSARRRWWSRRRERSRLWYDVSAVEGVGPRGAGDEFRLAADLVCAEYRGQHRASRADWAGGELTLLVGGVWGAGEVGWDELLRSALRRGVPLAMIDVATEEGVEIRCKLSRG